MSTFRVTIKDIVCWTTTVAAEDAIAAENLAWDLFSHTDLSEHFEDDSDTAVQLEAPADEPTNESSNDAHH